jgi:prepilin-type N-terminal cleavage/methylation domain-containing protein
MIPAQKTTQTPLNDSKGFTLMELMVVIAIIASLSAFAMLNYVPTRAKALDSAAFSDARNIVSSVVDATMNHADVDFTKVNTGGPVGDTDTAGNPRTPVYTLSPGVFAVITGGSDQGLDGKTTIFSAIIYHSGGSSDPLTLSGKKEFYCSVDEDAGTSTVPNF